MADRYFPNTIPVFVDETTVQQSFPLGAKDPLLKLLHLPYRTVCQKLQRAALDLKETVRSNSSISVHVNLFDFDINFKKIKEF